MELLAPELGECPNKHGHLAPRVGIAEHRVRQFQSDRSAVADTSVVQLAEALQNAERATNLSTG